jgi:hypothetical protein
VWHPGPFWVHKVFKVLRLEIFEYPPAGSVLVIYPLQVVHTSSILVYWNQIHFNLKFQATSILYRIVIKMTQQLSVKYWKAIFENHRPCHTLALSATFEINHILLGYKWQLHGLNGTTQLSIEVVLILSRFYMYYRDLGLCRKCSVCFKGLYAAVRSTRQHRFMRGLHTLSLQCKIYEYKPIKIKALKRLSPIARKKFQITFLS